MPVPKAEIPSALKLPLTATVIAKGQAWVQVSISLGGDVYKATQASIVNVSAVAAKISDTADMYVYEINASLGLGVALGPLVFVVKHMIGCLMWGAIKNLLIYANMVYKERPWSRT